MKFQLCVHRKQVGTNINLESWNSKKSASPNENETQRGYEIAFLRACQVDIFIEIQMRLLNQHFISITKTLPLHDKELEQLQRMLVDGIKLGFFNKPGFPTEGLIPASHIPKFMQ
jgi:hypothetical protein